MKLLISITIFLNFLKAENFEILDLSHKVKFEMRGVTWHKNFPVSLDNLKIIKIKYLNFYNQIKVGELIVHQKIADEVSKIFQILLKNNFNIYKIERISKYNGSDFYQCLQTIQVLLIVV